jgi:hypothetical protein
MATARRVQAGAFTTPAELGAVSVPVCRLSGLLATDSCARLTEWFAPGTAPTQLDTWEHDGRVTLPIEYAEWSRQGTAVAASGALSPTRPRPTLRPDSASAAPRQFSIISPRDGDRYAIPSGVDPRYATIPLRAGGRGASRVRWRIDGQPYAQPRWALAPGEHLVQATSGSGETAEARIVVER